jgi:two-component system sensor histidine kinase HydH
VTDELDSGKPILEREPDAFAAATPVSISAAKLTDSEGGQSGYLFILRDLGEVRRLQQQLKLNERLSALGNLAAGIAHEIRNPLSSIKGYATYLTEKVKEDKMAHATGMILIQETDRLNRVVSDLLSVARPVDLHLQPASIEELLRQAIRLVTPEAEEKKVAVTLALPAVSARADRHILIDADRLTQALLNLLVNAVQATDAGGTVRLALENVRPDGGEEALAVSVSDDGRGIAPRDMANLFTPYFTTKASGTGLGLAITQQIIAQHGGEITVRSKPGEGATFTILLPYRSAA